jgi:hypothetical protein
MGKSYLIGESPPGVIVRLPFAPLETTMTTLVKFFPPITVAAGRKRWHLP